MIQVQKLSYGVPAKELYKDISFSLESGQHCVLIGSNGTGKSTLADILMDPDEYMFDGKVIRDENCRIGYAAQFSARDKAVDRTVFQYLSERFVENDALIAEVCAQMGEAEDLEPLLEKYQALLDLHEAMDGDNYESNIHKQLYTAGMTALADTMLSQISGGEYKVLQIMREMLLAPNLLILDEPDVFLDFANLNSLCQLINGYPGIMLVITHNRYLLNHCFNKILHLENTELQEFEGSYTEYRCQLLKEKLRLKRQNQAEEEEIERTQEMVNILRKRASDMVNPVIGSSVNAKQTQLNRLKARKLRDTFIEMREPQIVLPRVKPGAVIKKLQPELGVVDEAAFETAVVDGVTFEAAAETAAVAEVSTVDTSTAAEIPATDAPATEIPAILKIEDYRVSYDDDLLEDVNLELKVGEKVAIVGANGTGKTTLIRDILNNNHPSIHIDENIKLGCLSQLDTGCSEDEQSILQSMQDLGYEDPDQARAYLMRYGLTDMDIHQSPYQLSGGEQNLLQLAFIGASEAELLILDEPSSHLDIYAQTALEKAIKEYKGSILMVSHDFYLIANCMDYVYLVEGNTIRRMRGRNFRKMVYDKYFDQKYLEVDRKRQEIENNITLAYKKKDLDAVEKLCNQLETLN